MDTIENVSIEKVIKIKFKKGTGEKEDPIRVAVQYWDMKGNLLKVIDPYFVESDIILSASSDNKS